MELTLSTLAEPIDDIPSDLRPVLEVLTKVEDSFFILARSKFEFIQGGPDADAGFYLEYTDDGPEGIHQYRQPLPLEAVAEITHRYLQGDDSWKDELEWEHRGIEPQEQDGFLGQFEGLSLRQVISELEKNEIEVRVEHQQAHTFMVFTTTDKAVQSKQLIAELFSP